MKQSLTETVASTTQYERLYAFYQARYCRWAYIQSECTLYGGKDAGVMLRLKPEVELVCEDALGEESFSFAIQLAVESNSNVVGEDFDGVTEAAKRIVRKLIETGKPRKAKTKKGISIQVLPICWMSPDGDSILEPTVLASSRRASGGGVPHTAKAAHQLKLPQAVSLLHDQANELPALPKGRSNVTDSDNAVRIVSEFHDAVLAYKMLMAKDAEDDRLPKVSSKQADYLNRLLAKLVGLKTQTLDQKSKIVWRLRDIGEVLGVSFLHEGRPCKLNLPRVHPKAAQGSSGNWRFSGKDYPAFLALRAAQI